MALVLVVLAGCGHQDAAPPPLLGMRSEELISKFRTACPGEFGITDMAIHCGLSGLKAYMVGFDERGRVFRITIDFHDSDDDILKSFDAGLSSLFPEPTRTKLRESITTTSRRVPVEGGAIRVVHSTTDREGREYKSIMWAD
jgi:hypothetical protein